MRSCMVILAVVVFCYAGLQASDQQVKTKYYIDVLAVADYAFYSKWLAAAGPDGASTAELTLKEYVAYLFKGVDERYATITSLPYEIRVQLIGIIVAKTAADSPWTENVTITTTGTGSSTVVRADGVLAELEKYIKNGSNTIPANDHLMLITGYDLIGRDASTSGYAGVRTVCTTNGLSVSVIEERGPSVTEATAAHELGHSLGAEHDGTNNTCSAADKYNMSPGGDLTNLTLSTSLNAWLFSNCSISYFDDNIQSLKKQGVEEKCLLQRLSQKGVPTVSAQLPPDPDEQCRQTYGPGSYLCREYVPTASDICQMMRCFNPSTVKRSCSLLPAASGTCCGKGKICQVGICVPKASETRCSSMSDVCPFGDQPQPVAQKNGEIKCADLPSQYCYEPPIQLKCCGQCELARINKAGCEFGDRNVNCDKIYCSTTTQTAPEEYDLECCGTCNANRPISSSCSDQAGLLSITVVNGQGEVQEKIEGETCQGALVDPENKRRCCHLSFRDTCCHSCEKRRGTSESCPFGDCAGSACNVLKGKTGTCTQESKTSCCQTCKEIEATTTASPSTTTARKSGTTTSSRNPNNETEDPCNEPGKPTCGACLLSANLSFVVALSSLSSCVWLLAASFGR